jgi:hypothetical protein
MDVARGAASVAIASDINLAIVVAAVAPPMFSRSEQSIRE